HLIKDPIFRRIAYIPGAELWSSRTGQHRPINFDLQRWSACNEGRRNLNDLNLSHREAEEHGESCSEKFTRQCSDSTRVVLEFRNIEVVVGGPQEMGLRASAHFPNVLDCGKESVHPRTASRSFLAFRPFFFGSRFGGRATRASVRAGNRPCN